MREMSTELEKKLEDRGRKGDTGYEGKKKQEVGRQVPKVRAVPPPVKKGPAPVAPNVKFNEGVEVVEVEQQKRRGSTISSDR